MKNKLFLSLIMLLMVLTSNAMAYNLQLTPGGSKDVTGDSFFDVFVVFNPDPGGNTLGSFGFNIFYDTNELTWDSLNTQLFLPSPLLPPSFSPNPFENTGGKISNFSGTLPFGSIAPSIYSPYTLAKISFNIDKLGVNSPTSDGNSDVWFDTSVNGFNINGGYVQMKNITIMGAPDIAVAPEPISSILFVTGGAVLGIRRFWKKI